MHSWVTGAGLLTEVGEAEAASDMMLSSKALCGILLALPMAYSWFVANSAPIQTNLAARVACLGHIQVCVFADLVEEYLMSHNAKLFTIPRRVVELCPAATLAVVGSRRFHLDDGVRAGGSAAMR